MLKNARWLALVGLLSACDERDRLTFPSNEPDDEGPATVIDIPSRDTVLTEGEPFVLGGRSVDTSGVDTVYFQILGGANYPPLPGEGADTVRFGLLIPTAGRAGQTISVTVHAVDLLGNRGESASRRLTIE